MTKNEFLNQLRARLSNLNAQEREKSVAYYAEMIDERMEEGMREEEAVASMEDVGVIASRIAAEHPAQPRKKFPGWAIALCVTAGVLVLCVLGASVLAVTLGLRTFTHQTSQQMAVSNNGQMEQSQDTASTQNPQDNALAAQLSGSGTAQDPVLVDTADVQTISIDWQMGEVDVKVWNGDTIRVREEGRSDLMQYQMQTTLQDGVLEIAYVQEENKQTVLDILSGIATSIFDDDMGKKLVVELPYTAALEMLEINCDMGKVDVEMEKAAAALQLGTIQINCDMADVEVEAPCSTLVVDNAAGDVDVSGQISDAAVTCDMGNIDFLVSQVLHSAQLTADMGNVEISVPYGVGVTLDAAADMGNVRVQARDTVQQNGVYILGDGACQIKAATSMGNVELEIDD
jgi:hypothetical protein